MLHVQRWENAGYVKVYFCILVILLHCALLASIHKPFLVGMALGGICLALAAIAKPSVRRELCLYSLLLPFALFFIAMEERLVTGLTPHTLDAALLRMESGASLAFYGWVSDHAACLGILHAVYGGLPLAAALILIVSARRTECMTAIVLAGLIAPVFYVLFPAVGPAWVNIPDAPRNCVPSLHMAWALILAVYSPSRLRVPAGLFAALTVCATLGLGEHYILDLVAAVPYTFAVCFLAGRTAIAISERMRRKTGILPPPTDSGGPASDPATIR
jgi:hypothetical protein